MATQQQALRYAVRPFVVAKYLGQLFLALAALTLAPLLVSLAAGEVAVALRYAAAASLLAGCGWWAGRRRFSPRVQANEAIAVTALAFLACPLAMAYPLMGAGLSLPDALFEAVSGVTTTGLTTVSVADKSAAFLFARAWMQWYGGLGIVVLSVALFLPPGLAAKAFSDEESPREDLVTGTKIHARRILVVYCCLSAAGFLGLWALGAGFFDAATYALAAVSTGGFSPRPGSLAGLAALPARWWAIATCLAGAVPLTAYLRAWRPRWTPSPVRTQVVALLLVCGATTAALSATMAGRAGATWPAVLRDAPLLALSAQTTAGFSTLGPGELGNGSKLVLVFAMMVGGAAGSTAGGFKVLRLVVLLRLVHLTVVGTGLPRHAVWVPRLGGRRLGEEDARSALVIVLVFAGVIAASWFPFVAWGYDPLDALFEVVSATGTVGLSSGITGPDLPLPLKGILCADMLLGRLEMIAWLVLLAPGTWFGRRASLS